MPARRPSRTVKTRKKAADWEKFIRELSKCGNVTEACRKAGVGRATANQRRKDNPRFAQQWEDALECGADRLEEEADRRASRGAKKLLLYKGAPVRLNTEDAAGLPGFVEAKGSDGAGLGWGYVYQMEFSDTLLIFLLKGLRPDKFADRKKIDARHSGELGVAVSKSLADEIAAARAARTSAEQPATGQEVPPVVAAAVAESAVDDEAAEAHEELE